MASVAEIVGIVVAAGGAAYAVGVRVGQSGHLKNDWYQAHKWEIRAGVLALTGIPGSVMLQCFESGFYSTLSMT